MRRIIAQQLRRGWIRSGRVLRVALLMLGIVALVLVFAVRGAVASVDDALLGLGRHVSVFAERSPGEHHRTAVINGQPLHFQVATTEHDVGTVLDVYEAWCRNRDGRFADQAAALEHVVASELREPSWRDLTLRERRGDEGFVACLATGVQDISQSELVERVSRFSETGNLADLGDLQYVYVTRGAQRTLAVSIWTEGDLFIGQMFPQHGDAPGADVPGIPRPPSGRRTLSARELGIDAALTIYIEGTGDLTALIAFYDRAFAAENWRVLARQMTGIREWLFLVERGDDMYAVGLGLDDDGQTFVTIAAAATERKHR